MSSNIKWDLVTEYGPILSHDRLPVGFSVPLEYYDLSVDKKISILIDANILTVQDGIELKIIKLGL